MTDRTILAIDPPPRGYGDAAILVLNRIGEEVEVVRDYTGRFVSLTDWANNVHQIASHHEVEAIVFMDGLDHQMMEAVLRAAGVPTKMVGISATRPGLDRYSAVAAFYDMGRLHCEAAPNLRHDIRNFMFGDHQSRDRLDALFAGLQELFRPPVPQWLGPMPV